VFRDEVFAEYIELCKNNFIARLLWNIFKGEK